MVRPMVGLSGLPHDQSKRFINRRSWHRARANKKQDVGTKAVGKGNELRDRLLNAVVTLAMSRSGQRCAGRTNGAGYQT